MAKHSNSVFWLIYRYLSLKSEVYASVLAAWDRFRTFEWAGYIEVPDLMLKQAKELLGLIKVEAVPVEA